MKKKIFLSAMIAASMLACRPEPFEDIGNNYDLTTGIDGSWEVSQVEIVDLTRPVPEKRNISDFFATASDPLGLNFDVSDQSYTVDNPASPGNFFGSSGTYQLTPADYPTNMQLVTVENDTINLRLLNMVRSIDQDMGLRLNRSGCTDQYLAYEFTFKRK